MSPIQEVQQRQLGLTLAQWRRESQLIHSVLRGVGQALLIVFGVLVLVIL